MSNLQLLQIGRGIVAAASQRGCVLRLVGSVAIAHYLDGSVDLEKRPAPVGDLDFISTAKAQSTVQRILAEIGWQIAPQYLLSSSNHEVFVSEHHWFAIDIYYDQIDGSHPLSLGRRLHCASPAISVTDLFLSKMQRRFARNVDLWDAGELMTKYCLTLEADYLGFLLGQSWGLYTCVMDNLELVQCEVPEAAECSLYLSRIAVAARKTICWRLRGLLGRRIRWWRPVEMTTGRVA